MAAPELSVARSGYGGRGYKHPHTGQLVPSVTTVLKQAASPGLTQWAVDQTAAYAVANIDSLLSRTEQQGWGFLRWYHKRNPLPLEEGYDIRNYHLGVLNDAAELGTSMHDWIEADVDDTRPIPDTTLESEAFWQMVDVWNDFQQSNFIEPILTEVTVWNADEGYAGTFDGLWSINGRLTLLDIKTARSLWPDHRMQLAALANATTFLTKNKEGEWEEFDWTDYTHDDGLDYKFIHIRPDDIDNKGSMVNSYVKIEDASENMDLYYQMFLGLLASKKAELAIADRQKLQKKSMQD